jgi:hypothetical protein
MKLSQLKQIIKEEIESTLKEEKTIYSQASDKAKELMQQLEDLALNGEIGNQDIEELKRRLRSARSRMFASKRSPEDREASKAKAASTREKNKQLGVDIRAQSDKEEREEQERRDNNFLPREIMKWGASASSIQDALGDLAQYYNVRKVYDDLYTNQEELVLISKYDNLQLPNAKKAWNVTKNL